MRRVADDHRWGLARRLGIALVFLWLFTPSVSYGADHALTFVKPIGVGWGQVVLADVRTGKILARRKVSDMGCGSVAFSPDGRYLITPSTGGLITWPYDRGGAIRVFRIAR